MGKSESDGGGNVHDWSVEAKRALQEASDRLEGFSTLSKKLEAFSTDMETSLTVAVVGEWNSGKSTFLNALLGADILPVGCLPTTGCVTLLRYAEEPALIVRYRDGIERSASLEELKRLAAHHHGDGPEESESDAVESLTVFYPAEILKKNVFIDTPGLNAPTDADRETTERALAESDVIVWLTSAQQVLSGTQFDVLRRYGERYRGKSICVISQTDLLEDAEGQTKVLLKHASDLLPDYFLDMVPVSARLALQGDEDQLRPFYRAFRNNIVQRTRYLKGSIALTNARTVVREEIAELERDNRRLASVRKDLEETRSAAECLIDEFVGAVKEVFEETDRALKRLRTSLVSRILYYGLSTYTDREPYTRKVPRFFVDDRVVAYREVDIWRWPDEARLNTEEWALERLEKTMFDDLDAKTSDLGANLVSNLEKLNGELMDRIDRSSKRLDPPRPSSELQGLLAREQISGVVSFFYGSYLAGIMYGCRCLQAVLDTRRSKERPSYHEIEELAGYCLPFDILEDTLADDQWRLPDEDARSEILMCYDRVEEAISGALESVNRDIQTLNTVHELLVAADSLTGITPGAQTFDGSAETGDLEGAGSREASLCGRRWGKRRSPEQKQRIMGEVERLRAEGKSVCAVLRKLGVPRSTYYYWRSENRASKSKTLPTA